MLDGAEEWLRNLEADVKAAVDGDRAIAELRKRYQRTTSYDEKSRIQTEIDPLVKAVEEHVLVSIPDHSRPHQTYLIPVEVMVQVRLEPRGIYAAYEPPTVWTELETHSVVVVSPIPLAPGMTIHLGRPNEPDGRQIVARIDASAILLLSEEERSTMARAAQLYGRVWMVLDEPPVPKSRTRKS